MVDCSLVAGTPVRDLLLCAKHLFVAAMLAGCGTTTHPSEPSRALAGACWCVLRSVACQMTQPRLSSRDIVNPITGRMVQAGGD